MKERPILMTAESVRALLADTKSQSRRVMKPQPNPVENDGMYMWHPYAWGATSHVKLPPCPYGVVGDHLWVKEALVEKQHPRVPLCSVVNYAADGALVIRKDAIGDVGYEEWYWQRPTLPAMFCPRWASRITLELTAVRVERVQDISVDDAIAEGITPVHDYWNDAAGGRFCDLWDSINKKRGYGWDVNPWVFVLSFRRVEA